MSPRAAVLLEAFGFEDVADYVTGKADWLARGLPLERAGDQPVTVGDLTIQGPVLEFGMVASDAAGMIGHQTGAGIIVGKGGVVLGLLTRERASREPDALVEDLMELGPSTFRADATPADALDYMDRHDTEQIVVSAPDGALIGLVTREGAKDFRSE